MNKSVLSGLRVTITHDQHQRLEAIDAEDFTPVARKVREHFEEMGRSVTDTYLDRGVYALKQYYALIVLDPRNIHGMSAAVDPFWHAHILHTEQYMRFSGQVVGEYIHHYPLDKKNARQMRALRPISDSTSEKLPMAFDDIDREFWPETFTDADLICADPCDSGFAKDLVPHPLFAENPQLRELGAVYRNA